MKTSYHDDMSSDTMVGMVSRDVKYEVRKVTCHGMVGDMAG
jgi:hypothetical protein